METGITFQRLRQYILLGLVGTALLIYSACINRSLHPWFSETDAVFEDWLLGKWIAHAEDETNTITFTRGEGNSYRIDYLEEKRDSKKAEHGLFEARLGRVDGVYYLDYRPLQIVERSDDAWVLRTHGLARLDHADGKLRIRLVNADQLEKAAKAGKLTEVKFVWIYDEVLLTSGTADLRRFLSAHAHEGGFFDPKGADFLKEK